MSNEADGPEEVKAQGTLFLFTVTDGNAVLILSDEVIKLLKKGAVLVTPHSSLIVSYSHDIEESAGQMEMMTKCTGGMIDKELLGFIVREGARPKKKRKKSDVEDNQRRVANNQRNVP